jgi:hypothetical protein
MTPEVQFERLMSFRPQIADALFGREPALRDIIFNYYASRIETEKRAAELTKTYIDKIAQSYGIGEAAA